LRGENNKTWEVLSTLVDGPFWLFINSANFVVGPIGAGFLTNRSRLSGQDRLKGGARGGPY